MLPAEAASRAAAREQFRHDVTRLWRGLLDAQQGDVAVSRLNERLAVWRQHLWRQHVWRQQTGQTDSGLCYCQVSLKMKANHSMYVHKISTQLMPSLAWLFCQSWRGNQWTCCSADCGSSAVRCTGCE